MNRTLTNSSKKFMRCVFVFAAMVFILLSSCPVKSSIKTLIGFPVKTEQGAAKGNHTFFGNNIERCVNSETTETSVSQIVSVNANNLLPAILFTAAFLFLIGYTLCKEQSHLRYGSTKISGALPIFLRYRKLII